MNVWLAGIIVLMATLGGTFFGSRWKGTETKSEAKAEHADVQYISGQAVTVPVVGGGVIEGYLMAKFGFSIDKSKLKHGEAVLQPLLNDEAFRVLYGAEAQKYKKPRKSDLSEISSGLVAGINKRLDSEAVKDVLIEDFSFIPKEKSRGGAGRH